MVEVVTWTRGTKIGQVKRGLVDSQSTELPRRTQGDRRTHSTMTTVLAHRLVRSTLAPRAGLASARILATMRSATPCLTRHLLATNALPQPSLNRTLVSKTVSLPDRAAAELLRIQAAFVDAAEGQGEQFEATMGDDGVLTLDLGPKGQYSLQVMGGQTTQLLLFSPVCALGLDLLPTTQ